MISKRKDNRRGLAPRGPNDPRRCARHISNRHLHGRALFMTEINKKIAYRNISAHLIGISRSRIKFAELLKP